MRYSVVKAARRKAKEAKEAKERRETKMIEGMFNDTYGNTFYRLEKVDGLHKYRILYKDTNHIFVGYISDRLQPFKGTYFTGDMQIEGLWATAAVKHEPSISPNERYKMSFTIKGEHARYHGTLSRDEDGSFFMHGEGELYLSERNLDYSGVWWDGVPGNTSFAIRQDGHLIYRGAIDECYDLHGQGMQWFKADHMFTSLATTFYHGVPLAGREGCLVYANGDVYQGGIGENGRPDGSGTLRSKSTGKEYSGRWIDGENQCFDYRTAQNVIYQSRLDTTNQEVAGGTYQMLPSGAVFCNQSFSRNDGLHLLAAVSAEIC